MDSGFEALLARKHQIRNHWRSPDWKKPPGFVAEANRWLLRCHRSAQQSPGWGS